MSEIEPCRGMIKILFPVLAWSQNFKQMKYTKHLISLLFVILISFACDKNNAYKDFPEIIVNTTIYPNSTVYQNLNFSGGWEYITAPFPSKGIIVYRFSQDEFRAYERTCPHDPYAENGRIYVEDSYTTAIDSACMTRYLLYDGSPFSGPGLYPLVQYQTYYNGNELRIFN